MTYQVIEKMRLIDALSEESIISIVRVPSLGGGHSLAIATKGAWLNTPLYGNPTIEDGICTVFLSLDRFTYVVPNYAAIPREYFKDIIILRKKAYNNGVPVARGEFYKARINKRVVF